MAFNGFHACTSLLCEGAVVSLWSRAHGTCLCVQGGELNAEGERQKAAEWKVHERDDGMVAFENAEHGNKWLRIKDDVTDCNGTGGNFCNFRVTDHDGNSFVSLESDKNPGQHVGVKEDGGIKPAKNTGKGLHGQFAIILKEKGPKHRPVMSSAHLLKEGAHVYLLSRGCGRTVNNGTDEIRGCGRSGEKATYIVDVKEAGVIILKCKTEPGKVMRIKDEEVDLKGTGGNFCKFYVHDLGNGFVALESWRARGQHVGIINDGTAKKPTETGRGVHGQFFVIVRETPNPNARSAAVPVESAPINAMSDGAVIHLYSRARGEYVMMRDNDTISADSESSTDKSTEWKVHRRDDMVALENEKHKGKFLRIKDGHTDFGTGGKFCDFHLHTNKEGYVCFESDKNRGQHIGILPNGDCKPPNETGKGLHGQFSVVLDEVADRKDQFPITPGSSFLKQNDRVVLVCRSRGRTLKLKGGATDGLEGTGRNKEWAIFVVHVKGPGKIALQHEKCSDKWLRIHNGETNVGGHEGGRFTYFYVHETEFGSVCLESVEHSTQHVGVTPDGNMKPPNETGKGKHGQFYVVLV